jgi:hypothetical protein
LPINDSSIPAIRVNPPNPRITFRGFAAFATPPVRAQLAALTGAAAGLFSGASA